MAQQPARLKHRRLPTEPGLNDGSRLDLKVIFTDLRETGAALTMARTMARGLGARITLMVAQVVPYPLPLAEPDVSVDFTERRLESLAAEDTAIEIYLCRDRCETIRGALPPGSVVIVGAQKWRWPFGLHSWKRRLARMLRHDGQRVLVVTA